MKKFMHQWFTFNFEGNGHYCRAECIDIEFQTGFRCGPIFLFRTKAGNTFWLTREEIKDHEVTRKRKGV